MPLSEKSLDSITNLMMEVIDKNEKQMDDNELKAQMVNTIDEITNVVPQDASVFVTGKLDLLTISVIEDYLKSNDNVYIIILSNSDKPIIAVEANYTLSMINRPAPVIAIKEALYIEPTDDTVILSAREMNNSYNKNQQRLRYRNSQRGM